MTMHELLVQVLNTRYNNLLNEYARLDNGTPEQDAIAEEMDRVDFELFQLNTAPRVIPTRDDNWGRDALDAIGSPSDDFFEVGLHQTAKWVN